MSREQVSYSRKGWSAQDSILTTLGFGMTNFEDHVLKSEVWSSFAEFLDAYSESPIINSGDGWTDSIQFVQGDSTLWEREGAFDPDRIDNTIADLTSRYSRWVAMNPTTDLGRISSVLTPIADDQRSRSVEATLTVIPRSKINPPAGWGPNWTDKMFRVATLALQIQGVSDRRIKTNLNIQNLFSRDGNDIMLMISQTTPRYLLMAIYEFARRIEIQEAAGEDYGDTTWTLGRIIRHDQPHGGPDAWEGMGTTYLQPVGHAIHPHDMQGDDEWRDRREHTERVVRSEFILAYGATHDDMIYMNDLNAGATGFTGDLLFVNCFNWTGVGLVLDGMRTPTSKPPILIPMGATGDDHAYLDLWSFLKHGCPAGKSNDPFFDSMWNRESQKHPFGIGKNAEIIFPSSISAATFLHARLTLESLSASEGTVDPTPEPSGTFIPAWKDKRGKKVIDHTGGRFPVFHDEVRCSVCNGRVLVLMPAGNQTGEWDCPHCDEKKAVKFKHLISPQHSGSDAPKESEK